MARDGSTECWSYREDSTDPNRGIHWQYLNGHLFNSCVFHVQSLIMCFTSMKTQVTPFHNVIRTCTLTEPILGRKSPLPLLMRLLWAAALVLPGFVAQAGVSFTSLYSFHVFPNGENPEAGLVQGSDGNLYGTTSAGGTNGHFDDHGIFVGGTVFKIGTNGGLTTLHSFTGGNDGGFPEAGLVQGSDGNLYGTTYYGGTNGAGTVFKISTDGTLTTLHSFAGGNDGGCSAAGLVQGSDGNFLWPQKSVGSLG